MTEAVIEGEKLRHELETARLVQMSTLPNITLIRSWHASWPLLAGGAQNQALSDLNCALRLRAASA